MSFRPQFTCNKCGWVHFAALRSEGASESGWGGGCYRCRNPYTNFRPAKESDAPMGVTIQGILIDDDHPAVVDVKAAIAKEQAVQDEQEKRYGQ